MVLVALKECAIIYQIVLLIIHPTKKVKLKKLKDKSEKAIQYPLPTFASIYDYMYVIYR